jgi:predicted metal-binding membrane protein
MPLSTSLPASLLHPTAMLAFVAAWAYTATLGYRVRMERLSASGSDMPLVDSGIVIGSSKGSQHHKLSAALFALTVATTLLGMSSAWTSAQCLRCQDSVSCVKDNVC